MIDSHWQGPHQVASTSMSAARPAALEQLYVGVAAAPAVTVQHGEYRASQGRVLWVV